MEAKAAEVLVPPHSSLDLVNSEGEAAACTSSSFSDSFRQMEEFSRRLEDIIRTHGSASSITETQWSVVEAELEKMKEDGKGDFTAAVDSEVSVLKQTLNNVPPEEKQEELFRKYSEMAAAHRCDEHRLNTLQRTLSILLGERQQLQAEHHCSVAARIKLETLCRELQAHQCVLREEALQRCREDERKRSEITSHFQDMLTEIQAQIEQHSARNDKLCRENSNLSDKLESLMNQCERREESLEKINKHRDLQHQLTEAKLQQANAQLAEAEEKHKREKEYLLVQAAEWKLQAQTLREQGTVMQAQLKLYGEKFDEFQETLAKSNEIYVRFKKEMENMSDKMKNLEKESNLWKTRFENCNKALTDMIDERREKGQEYELFVLKIQRLETLCRALQDERKVLYDKIKEVCQSNANLPSKFTDLVNQANDANEGVLVAPEELQEEEEQDEVLTLNMARLRAEQAKLKSFAASLFAKPEEGGAKKEREDLEAEVASGFIHFKAKTQVQEGQESKEAEDKTTEFKLSQPLQSEEVPSKDTSEPPKPEETSSPPTQTEPRPDVHMLTGAEEKQQTVKDDLKEIQLPLEPEPEPSTAEITREEREVRAPPPAEEDKPSQQLQSGDSAPAPEENKSAPAASSEAKKPKKKKKRSSRSES
ncbi:beta-taxilin isoform X2 [Oryzias melastigma]|uniref:beta-taxilin isoform X2 n=1 Tax=Oryzias melastigma TaxID=30732 RepID=UPI000CF81FAF|nr:beta-taxilin isoform X2 [Oryzias melastigma]